MARARTVHKDERIYVRASAEQKARLRAAAEANGETVSSFMMRCALREARVDLLAQQEIALSARDSLAMAQALLDPPAPIEALVAAAQDLAPEWKA